MSRWRLAGLRLLVLWLALALPVLWALNSTGTPPRSLAVDDLDAWSPVRSAGPSAQFLARGLTGLVGVAAGPPPEWTTPEDREMLARAEGALGAGKLKEAMGHLFILSSRLEERGKTVDDLLPTLLPGAATWVVANVFAPVLLATGGLGVIIVVFTPWLLRRLYEFVKLLVALAAAIAAMALLASLGFALVGKRALVYALIEYMALVAVLLLVGNALVFLAVRRCRVPMAALAPALPPPALQPVVIDGMAVRVPEK